MDNLRELLLGFVDLRVLLASFLAGAALILLGGYVPRLSGRAVDIVATQAMHHRITPRVGGVGILLAAALACLTSTGLPAGPVIGFGAAAMVIFAVGLSEDLGFHVAPRGRLGAAVFATVLVMVGFDVWLPRIDLPVADALLSHWLPGMAFTILIVAGVTNAFNLIDGVNGLASFTGIVGALTLAMIALLAGDQTMAYLAVIVATAILGFFALNYPFGLIFLGDAGAYLIGFTLSWIGVSLVHAHGEVTPWAVLLAMFWPMADTVFAMARRIRRRRAVMQPDRMHAHQMVLRGLEIAMIGRGRRRLANPATTAVLAPFVMVPPIAGVLLWNQPLAAFLAVVGFLCAFGLSFKWLTLLVRRRSLVRHLKRPVVLAAGHLALPARALAARSTGSGKLAVTVVEPVRTKTVEPAE